MSSIELNYFEACPICGKPNECAVQQGTSASKCWCMEYDLSEDAQKELDIHNKDHGGGCVCQDCLKRLSETGALRKPTKWDYFKFGIKIHPGNIFYVGFLTGLLVAVLRSPNLRVSLIAGIILAIPLFALWITTSIDVGRVNWKHRKEILNE